MLIAVIVFLAAWGYYIYTASDWDSEDVIRTGGNSGVSAECDSSDTIHIALGGYLHDEYGLIYGQLSDGEWTLTEIQPLDDMYGDASIAVGPDGGVHIATCPTSTSLEQPGRDVLYATDVTDGWHMEILPTDSEPESPIVVLDRCGEVDIFYVCIHSADDSVLNRAFKNVSGWSTVEVQLGGRIPVHLFSATTDTDGRTHVLFSNRTSEDFSAPYGLCYALLDGESATVRDLPYSEGSVASMTLDGVEEPVVGLVENSTGIPMFSIARIVEGDWSFDDIMPAHTSDDGVPAIAIGSQGDWHLTLSVGVEGGFPELWYATNSSGSWAAEKIGEPAPPSSLIFNAPIVVDSEGIVSVFCDRYLVVGKEPFRLVHTTSHIDAGTRSMPMLKAALWSSVTLIGAILAQHELLKRRRKPS